MQLHISVSRHVLFIFCSIMMRLLTIYQPPLSIFWWRENQRYLPFPPMEGPSQRTAPHSETSEPRRGHALTPTVSRYVPSPHGGEPTSSIVQTRHPSTPANLGRKGQDVNRSQKPLLGSLRSLSRIEGSNARRTPALTSAPPLPSLLPTPQDRDDANRERPRAAPPPGARRRARSRAPIHR